MRFRKAQSLSAAVQPVKVGLLFDATISFFTKALEASAFLQGVKAELVDLGYDLVETNILDRSSGLYHNNLDFVLLGFSDRKAFTSFCKTLDKASFASKKIELIDVLCTRLAEKSSTKAICLGPTYGFDPLFGNHGLKVPHSFVRQQKAFELGLLELADKHKNLFVQDVCSLVCVRGTNTIFDEKLYINADQAFSMTGTALLAEQTAKIIGAVAGFTKKCLVTDLDNTMWGGVVGDIGLENIQIGDLGIGKAYTNYQLWLKELKERGIILAVCSKNYEETAKRPFVEHPEMVLELEDFAVFIANWESKAENLKKIAEILNIGMDSLVFIDDNPAERSLVRSQVSAVAVPELPNDPVDYLQFLIQQNLFEVGSVSGFDKGRTQQYREDASRFFEKEKIPSPEEFLTSLEMRVKIEKFEPFAFPRIAQLTQRTNQFNLRTVRYTETDIERFAKSKKFFCYSFSLSDRFGDSGLVSVVILEEKPEGHLFIDTWLMSCRVFQRTLEHYMTNWMKGFARARKITIITAEYLPTPKNLYVEHLLPNMGFVKEAQWTLHCVDTSDLRSYLKET